MSKKIVHTFIVREIVGLKPIENHVLMHLAAREHDGSCYPSIDLLTLVTGLSRSSVQRAIAGLLERGLITYERGGWLKDEKGERQKMANTYYLQEKAERALMYKRRGSHRHPMGVPQTPYGCPTDLNGCLTDTHMGVPQTPQRCNYNVLENVQSKDQCKVSAEGISGMAVEEQKETSRPSIPENNASTLAPAPRAPKLSGRAPDGGSWEGWEQRRAA